MSSAAVRSEAMRLVDGVLASSAPVYDVLALFNLCIQQLQHERKDAESRAMAASISLKRATLACASPSATAAPSSNGSRQ